MTGFWLHRLLEAHGVCNYVIDPASVQVDRRARRTKTDGVDAGRMLRSLMAHLRGEPKVWSVVRVPTVAEEDERRLHRERGRLVSERVQHVNRIKALCALHGIYHYEPIRPDRLQALERLRTADRRALPPRVKAEIVRELQCLELVLEMLKTVEAERDAIASVKTAPRNAKKIQDLVKLKHRVRDCQRAGWRGVLSLLCQWPTAGELRRADAQPFPERLDVPRSGDQQGRQCQGPHEDDRARLDVVASPAREECLVPPTRWNSQWSDPPHYHRAMARRLLIALWRYLETGVVPAGVALKKV
jgi:transposase